MEEKTRAHDYHDGCNAVSVGAGFTGGINAAAVSASAASSAAAVAPNDGGLNYRALILQERSELEELRRAAREKSPRE